MVMVDGDGSIILSLAPEPAESRYQAENQHYMCRGSRPSRCRNLDAVKGRKTRAGCRHST